MISGLEGDVVDRCWECSSPIEPFPIPTHFDPVEFWCDYCRCTLSVRRSRMIVLVEGVPNGVSPTMRSRRLQGQKLTPRSTPAGRALKASKVYLIRDATTGLVKIGSSQDPGARLRSLQTGSGTELELIGWLDGTERRERELHAEYADARVRGEWFALTLEQCQSILGGT